MINVWCSLNYNHIFIAIKYDYYFFMIPQCKFKMRTQNKKIPKAFTYYKNSA